MPARKLERFTVQITADDKKFKSVLDRSARQAKTWGRSVRRGINTGFVLGGAAAIAGLTALIKQTSAAIDAQAKFADVIGLTTEQFAGFQVAAKITGVEMSQVNTAVTRMLKNIGDAEDGLSNATNAFSKLNLTASELKKLETHDQIKLIADRFTELKSPVDKASVLINVFGRAGINFGKLLEQGSEGIERFAEEARILGLAVSRVDAAKVEAANDAMARARFIFNAAGRTLSVELAPIIEGVANKLVDAAKEAGGMGELLAGLAEKGLAPIGSIADGVHAIGLLWQGAEAAMQSYLSLQLKVLSSGPRVGRAIRDALDIDIDPDNLGLRFIGLSDELTEVANKSRADFQKALLEPLPSQKIKDFINDARGKAQSAAEAASAKASIDLNILQSEKDLEAFFEGFESVIDNRNKLFNKTADGLRQEIALFGDVTKAAKLRYELEQGELSKLSDTRKDILINLAVQVDNKNLAEENKKVIDLQDEKFKRMREAALDAAGLTRQLEHERFQAELALLEEERDRILEMTMLSEQQKADIKAQFQQAERDAATIHAKNLTDIEKEEAEKRNAIKQAQLDAAGNFFGLVGNLAKEGSKAQRIAFAAEKAAAVAKALLNLQVAISQASTLPPPANFAAMAQAAATGAGILANIRSVAVAHGGLDLSSINMRQDEMTVIAQRGERILSRDQNKEVTQMAQQFNNSAGQPGAAGAQQAAPPNVAVFIDGDSMMNFVASDRGGAAVMQHIAFNKDEVNTILGRG